MAPHVTGRAQVMSGGDIAGAEDGEQGGREGGREAAFMEHERRRKKGNGKKREKN